MDTMKEWLDYYRNKTENKKKYGENVLPKRPNSSKKAYDSEKIKKRLKEIDRIFETPDETRDRFHESIEEFSRKIENHEMFKLE